VPPSELSAAVTRLTPVWRFVAQHGVGVIDAATDVPDADHVNALRHWTEGLGGSLVVTRSDDLGLDPWGAPPVGLALQRRIASTFDPYGVANPGRLPGGV
jgi:hypothetical protein